jgi:hypothetical protein
MTWPIAATRTPNLTTSSGNTLPPAICSTKAMRSPPMAGDMEILPANRRKTEAPPPAIGHLTAMKDEIGAFDPESLNIDNVGDRAEIARQVLTILVDELRGFGTGARMGLAEKEYGSSSARTTSRTRTDGERLRPGTQPPAGSSSAPLQRRNSK